jgi:hypothetical protein
MTGYGIRYFWIFPLLFPFHGVRNLSFPFRSVTRIWAYSIAICVPFSPSLWSDHVYSEPFCSLSAPWLADRGDIWAEMTRTNAVRRAIRWRWDVGPRGMSFRGTRMIALAKTETELEWVVSWWQKRQVWAGHYTQQHPHMDWLRHTPSYPI